MSIDFTNNDTFESLLTSSGDITSTTDFVMPSEDIMAVKRPHTVEKKYGEPPAKKAVPAPTSIRLGVGFNWNLQALAAAADAVQSGSKSPVSALNELGVRVHYTVLRQGGPAHCPSFTVSVTVADMTFEGWGHSKRTARASAARACLAALLARAGRVLPSSEQQDFTADPSQDKALLARAGRVLPSSEQQDFTADPSQDKEPEVKPQETSTISQPPLMESPANSSTPTSEASASSPWATLFGATTTPQTHKSPINLLYENYPGLTFTCTFGDGTGITDSNTLAAPAQLSHSMRFKVVCNVKDQKFEGYGSSKKLAKLACARSALAVLSEGVVSSTPAAQETPFLPQTQADLIGKLVNEKFHEIIKGDVVHSKRKVLAGIVITINNKPDGAKVVAVTTGTKCVSGEHMSVRGRAVNDCHAEVAARRCLQRHLYAQLLEYSNSRDPRQTIPESDLEPVPGGGYQMKPDRQVHLYVSTAPCGDGRIFSPHEQHEPDKHPNRLARGQLRTKIESGEGTIPVKNCTNLIQTWDGVLQVLIDLVIEYTGWCKGQLRTKIESGEGTIPVKNCTNLIQTWDGVLQVLIDLVIEYTGCKGQLRTKIESGEGTIPVKNCTNLIQTWDGVLQFSKYTGCKGQLRTKLESNEGTIPVKNCTNLIQTWDGVLQVLIDLVIEYTGCKGQLRTKIESGEGTIPVKNCTNLIQTWDGVLQVLIDLVIGYTGCKGQLRTKIESNEGTIPVKNCTNLIQTWDGVLQVLIDLVIEYTGCKGQLRTKIESNEGTIPVKNCTNLIQTWDGVLQVAIDLVMEYTGCKRQLRTKIESNEGTIPVKNCTNLIQTWDGVLQVAIDLVMEYTGCKGQLRTKIESNEGTIPVKNCTNLIQTWDGVLQVLIDLVIGYTGCKGQLRTKIESGEGTIPVKNCTNLIQTWDGVLQGERLLTMSCSDKVARWCVVGLQGALLSRYIRPVYLHSLVLGSLLHPHHMYRQGGAVVRGGITRRVAVRYIRPVYLHSLVLGSLHPPYVQVSGSPQGERLLTMSCSDKVARWCVVDYKARCCQIHPPSVPTLPRPRITTAPHHMYRWRGGAWWDYKARCCPDTSAQCTYTPRPRITTARTICTGLIKTKDKVARWCVVGLKGALLSRYIRPVYLHSLVLGSLLHPHHMYRITTAPAPYVQVSGSPQGERLLTMSCSDKVARWCVVGLQGALLSRYIRPVYLHSLVLGSLLHPHHMYRITTTPAPYVQVSGSPQGERLLTMSCSDKVARWCVVGLQGALLSRYIRPVYLHSLVLGSLLHPHHMYR
ncbi:adenosine-deaminase (editase) domain-containing protein [Phthorimaea operculella]|nr:adenosine-deaminase (editase) domain-containing protein [Phthorimaea operculella]